MPTHNYGGNFEESAPSFVSYFRTAPEADALERAQRTGELTAAVFHLAEADVLDAGELVPCSIIGELRRVLGEPWAAERSLMRRDDRLSRPEEAPPASWALTVLNDHPRPAEVLESAFPSQRHQTFVLRTWVWGALSKSVCHRLGGQPHLAGEALLGHWRALPASGRAAFPAHLDAAIHALAKLSPAGELRIGMPGHGNYFAMLSHALLLEGRLAAWLASEAGGKKSQNGGSR